MSVSVKCIRISLKLKKRSESTKEVVRILEWQATQWPKGKQTKRQTMVEITQHTFAFLPKTRYFYIRWPFFLWSKVEPIRYICILACVSNTCANVREIKCFDAIAKKVTLIVCSLTDLQNPHLMHTFPEAFSVTVSLSPGFDHWYTI